MSNDPSAVVDGLDSTDPDEFDEAVVDVIRARDDEDEDAAIERIMTVAARRDEATKQDAIGVVESKTRKTKSEAKALLRDHEGQRSRELLAIDHIEKIVPVGDADEYRYRFHVEAGGERGVVELTTGALVHTPHQFQQQVFELTGTKVSFPEWDDTLNQWMDETEVVERDEDPLSNAHALAESFVDRVRGMEVVTSRDEFRSRPLHALLYEPGENRLLVAGKVIDDLRQSQPGDVSMQKARNILDPVSAGNSESIEIEDDFSRVWPFDADLLATTADIDLSRAGGDDDA